MKTQDATITRREQPRRRGWLIATAVFLAVLAAGAAVLLTGNGEPDVADTPQGIAELFIEGDATTAVGLLANDAVFDHSTATSVEEYSAFRDWQVATGAFATVTECSETPAGVTVEVSCSYIHGNAWSEALDVGPYDGSKWVFVIGDGQIQELRQTFDFSEFAPQANLPFRRWLEDAHPADFMMMTQPEDKWGSVTLTPESIALWEQYTNEFVASQAEAGTP